MRTKTAAAALAIFSFMPFGAPAQEIAPRNDTPKPKHWPVTPAQKTGYEGFWDHSYLSVTAGYVFRWDDSGNGKNTLYGPTGGEPLYDVTIEPPKTWWPHIASAAVDSNGLVALAYTSVRQSGSWHGGIALLDQSGRVMRFIDTLEYSPSQVCFAPDRSLWVYGQDEFRPVRDYPVFRRYSPDGQQLGGYVLRSSLPPWESSYTADGIAAPIYGGRRIFASASRIGALLWTAGSDQLWVELDFSGNLLGQWKVDIHHSPSAFTANSDLCAAVWQDRRIVGTAVLNKTKNEWDPVEGVPLSMALGADGENLIYRMKTNPPISFLGWFVPHREEIRAGN